MEKNAIRSLPLWFDRAALDELLAVIEKLSTYLHPYTSHSEPGDEEALERAERVMHRYKKGAA